MVREKVDQVQADLVDNKKPDGQRTIFHDFFTNDSLIPEERTPESLAAEGVGIVSAGSAAVPTLWLLSHMNLVKLNNRCTHALSHLVPHHRKPRHPK